MTRLVLALAPLALLAGCNEKPANDSRAASGEVLEGTISDAMLPIDRVRSEPPLEDPDAFAEAQEKAAEDAPADAAAAPDEGEAPDAAATEAAAPATPPPEHAD
jgi:hypothetical protein